MPLSVIAITKARPAAAPYRLSDEKGLYIIVRPNGAKWWRFDYRFNGRRKTLSLGVYPEVGLADARQRRDSTRALVATGVDPSEVRREAPPRDHRLEAVARDWYAARRKNWSDRYAETIMNRLEADVFPRLGERPVPEITASEILTMLRAVEGRGAIEAARRIKSNLSEVFAFAQALGLVKADPTAGLGRALSSKARTKHRAAFRATELPAFLVRLRDATEEDADTIDAMWLTLLTAVRTVETRFAACEEFEDIDRRGRELWRISADRMKMKNEHLVPLSRQAAEIVRRRILMVGGKGLLFPRRTVSGTLSENTMLYALYRMGYHSKATVHGFRGTFSTILNEATRVDDGGTVVRMFDSDWIERQLAHVESDDVRGAYNSAQWIGPRRTMLQWWADYLDEQEEVGRIIG